MLGSTGETIISAEKLARWLYDRFADGPPWESTTSASKDSWREGARLALDAAAVEL